MLTDDSEEIADERGTGDTSRQPLNFELTLLRGEKSFFCGTFIFICQLKFSHVIGRIKRDRICRQGSIGDTGQKEGNSEFSFLAKFRKGEFFTSAVTRRVAMLLPCFLRYPGMLQGYVLLLGNFPSMRIPIDQTEAARYGAEGEEERGEGGGGQVCPTKGSKWRGCNVNTLSCLFVPSHQRSETLTVNYH